MADSAETGPAFGAKLSAAGFFMILTPQFVQKATVSDIFAPQSLQTIPRSLSFHNRYKNGIVFYSLRA